MKFLIRTEKSDWRIVTDKELRTMLDNKEFHIYHNGYADIGINVLRDDLGRLGSVYPVSVIYKKTGWVVADMQAQVFLRSEEA